MLTNQRVSSGPDILQNAEYYPARMAQYALSWKRMGAQIIGGCLRFRSRAHQRHAAGGQRERRRLNTKDSISRQEKGDSRFPTPEDDSGFST